MNYSRISRTLNARFGPERHRTRWRTIAKHGLRKLRASSGINAFTRKLIVCKRTPSVGVGESKLLSHIAEICRCFSMANFIWTNLCPILWFPVAGCLLNHEAWATSDGRPGLCEALSQEAIELSWGGFPANSSNFLRACEACLRWQIPSNQLTVVFAEARQVKFRVSG